MSTPTRSGTVVIKESATRTVVLHKGPAGPAGPKGDEGDEGPPGPVETIVPGAGITVDSTDPKNPIVSATATGGGTVDTIVPGAGISVDDTDPANPIVSATGGAVDTVAAGAGIDVDDTDPANPVVINTGVLTLVEGTNVTIDATDPQNPIISASGGGGGGSGVVETIVEGDGISVDATDPANPIVTNTGVLTLVEGTNITIDATDPQNPVISASGGGGGGGLVYWTESYNTTSPNNVRPLAVFTATGAEDDIDAVVQPKGQGGFSLRQANGSWGGGAKLGYYAVDLHVITGHPNSGATGFASFAAGSTNRVFGQYAVGLGFGNDAYGQSAVSIGDGNVAYGAPSLALGSSNQIMTANSMALGFNGYASGQYAMSLDGGKANQTGCVAIGPAADTRVTHYAWHESSQGGCPQRVKHTLFNNNVYAAATVLTTSGSAGAYNNQVSLGSDVQYRAGLYHGMVVAKRKDGSGRTKSWYFYAHIQIVAGVIELVAPVVPVVVADTGEPWGITVDVDLVNNVLQVITDASDEDGGYVAWSAAVRGIETAGHN